MTRPTLGSLFSGAGLLDLAVADALGARTLWVAETDAAASRVLAERFPDVPNHGDVRALPERAEPVTISAGGYPCQGESNAGKRLGDADPRWMWPAYRDLIAAMRPKLAIGENVRAHLGRSFRHVVADLLELGYAVAWGVVAASDVGACHERKRLWWVAWPADFGPPVGFGAVPFAHLEAGAMVADGLFGDVLVTDWPVAGAAYAGAAYAGAAYAGAAPGGELLPTVRTSDTNGAGAHGDGGLDLRTAVTMLPTTTARDHKGHNQRGDASCLTGALLPTPTATDAASSSGSNPAWGHGTTLTDAARAVALLPTTTAADGDRTSTEHIRGNPTLLGALMPTPRATDGVKGGPNQRGSSGDLTLPSAVQPERFGPYAPAVARWEALTRPAPDPTEPGRSGKPRLSPAFAEWLMGTPAGWITDVDGVSRTDALRLAGNGVVRQQGAAAVAWLARRLPAALRAELGLGQAVAS
jgi:DNA (cytosine-5)-methyltransferase 1